MGGEERYEEMERDAFHRRWPQRDVAEGEMSEIEREEGWCG